jgi:hypothetical protein
VQTAVDTKHHMIVAHEVTNVGHDRDQLSQMAQKTRDAIDERDLTVFADRGYYKGQQVYDCEQAGIKTLVPKPQTSRQTVTVNSISEEERRAKLRRRDHPRRDVVRMRHVFRIWGECGRRFGEFIAQGAPLTCQRILPMPRSRVFTHW